MVSLTARTTTLFGLALSILAACASEEVGGPARPPVASPTVASPTETAPPPEPAVPSPLIPEHGGTYWGVYLAEGEESDLEDAIAYLTQERGIEEFSIGDVNCDEGAREALGEDAGPLHVAVYFGTKADAQVWGKTLPGPPVAIAQVRTFCLD